MTQLDPAGAPIDIGDGITVVATGIAGDASTQPTGAGDGLRSFDKRSMIADAVTAHGGTVRTQVELRDLVALSPPPGVRASQVESSVELRMAAPVDGSLVVLAAHDANGFLTWHLPRDQEAGPVGVRASGELVFDLRLHGEDDHAPPLDGEMQRGILGAIARKVIEVIVLPLAERLVGAAGEFLVDAWEREHRPHRLRTVSSSDIDQPDGGRDVSREDLADWGQRRGLLLIHGTFNRTPSSFAGLVEGRQPGEATALHALLDRYEERVVAFDHPSVGTDPDDNVAWLLDRLPPGLHLDVIGTSRGGLVARALAARTGRHPHAPTIERIVFSATPNRGTPLVDTAHMGRYIDVVTNLLRWVPDNGVTDTLEVILAVLKRLATGVADGLPGLQAMHPKGTWLANLPDAGADPAGYAALGSDYEPDGSWTSLVKDLAMDLVFREPNDLVVPTSSVLGPWGASAWAPDRTLLFGRSDHVTHGGFLPRVDVQERLLAWLA